jgi:(p)ppGpp synthase/HD superfamily hydrolase
MNDRQRDFLISLDANKTRHSGRTLFDHLKGVHDLLRDWDNDYDVCLAGLFHSIYGTNVFKHKSLHDRGELVNMIGVKAELLVHAFATQREMLFASVEDKDTRQKLLEIEAANLIEQGSSANTLRKLSRMKLSNGAKAALMAEVG